MNTVYRFERGLVHVERLVVGVSIGVLLLTGLVQVSVRLLGIRSMGTDEIAAVAMIALIFIGAALTTATGASISVDVADFIPSARIRRLVGVVVHVVVLIFGVTFTYFTYKFAMVSIETGEVSLQLGIPKSVHTLTMMVGGALLTLHAILRLIAYLLPSKGWPELVDDGSAVAVKEA